MCAKWGSKVGKAKKKLFSPKKIPFNFLSFKDQIPSPPELKVTAICKKAKNSRNTKGHRKKADN